MDQVTSIAQSGESRYWRIRSKCAGRDFSAETWARSEAGIWYGAWTATDFIKARRSPDVQILQVFNSLSAQKELGWMVSESYLKTALRFADIAATDWILVYLPGDQMIGLGRLKGDLQSEADHPCNVEGEVFKFRRIVEKKVFRVSDLPDAYRLMAAQGRSNVHEFHSMRTHVARLAECLTTEELNNRLKAMPFAELLDFLGASAWESFCFAYLIMEESFVPTGLSVGRTLKDIDIIGRARGDGRRIIAQCKKDIGPMPIDPNFVAALTSSDIAYYFAYGGVSEEIPDGIQVVERRDALKWATSTGNGRLYKMLLLGEIQ